MLYLVIDKFKTKNNYGTISNKRSRNKRQRSN